MMSMKIKETTMIYPAEQTPKSSIWLSSLDLWRSNFSSILRTHHLFIYENVNKTEHHQKFFDTSILKSSLSRVLVPFYVMAGRLRKQDDGRFEINCNAEGVLFVEAETTQYFLSDFGNHFTPNEVLKKLVIPTYDDHSKEISSVPVLIVQLTRFKCGGVCLDVAIDHQVVDGLSTMHLMISWARLARQLDLTDLPYLDRSYFAARVPPVVQFDHLEYKSSLPPLPPPRGDSGEITATTECIFQLTKQQINALKEEVASPKSNYKLSTYEVVAAHIWRCATKARELTYDQDVKLYIIIDGRKRLKNPSVPHGYFGNVSFFASCTAKGGDIIFKPLWYVANKIHETIKEMGNSDYLRSAVDYLEMQIKPTSPVIRGPHSVCPNLSINSWGAFPSHDVDFGWGAPKFVRHGGIRFEGQSYLIPSILRDGSFSLAIKLYKPHIPVFESYFLLKKNFLALGRL